MRGFLIVLFSMTIISISSCASRETKRTSEYKKEKFIRKDVLNNDKSQEGFKEDQRYHSIYHTNNPYYDARNMILDGDLEGALELLTVDINSLDYPARAALWVFICKCKLGDQKGAETFLNEFILPLKIDPEDKSVINTMLLYYHNVIDDAALMKRIDNLDDLDNCASYYYYGAYKRYYAGDYVTGIEYMTKALNTNVKEYSECKFAEKEIKGFTYRNTGQYEDYPITQLLTEEEAALLISNDNDSFTENTFGNIAFDDVSDPQGEGSIITELDGSLGEGQYLVPSQRGDGWEIHDLNDMVYIIKDEAKATLAKLTNRDQYIENMIFNKINTSDDFTLFENGFFILDGGSDDIIYVPTSALYETYGISFGEYVKNESFYDKEFGTDYSTTTIGLKEGDFLSGAKVRCKSYNHIFETFQDDVVVSVNLMFTVQDDRTTELMHFYYKILDTENY